MNISKLISLIPKLYKKHPVIAPITTLGAIAAIPPIVSKEKELITGSKENQWDWYKDNLYEAASFFGNRRGRRSIKQKDVGDAGTNACAAWSNSYLRNKGYKVRGNAWGLSNVKTVLSGYTKPKPKTDDYQTLQRYNWDAADALKKKFNSFDLNPNKTYIVNLYSTGSPYQRESFNHGTSGYGSHTGQLRNDNGEWYLYHNWHGTVKKTPIENVLGSDNELGITAIYTPLKKYGGKLNEKNYFATFNNYFNKP